MAALDRDAKSWAMTATPTGYPPAILQQPTAHRLHIGYPPATHQLPSNYPLATLKISFSYPQATLQLPIGYPPATHRLPSSSPSSTLQLPTSYPLAVLKQPIRSTISTLQLPFCLALATLATGTNKLPQCYPLQYSYPPALLKLHTSQLQLPCIYHSAIIQLPFSNSSGSKRVLFLFTAMASFVETTSTGGQNNPDSLS